MAIWVADAGAPRFRLVAPAEAPALGGERRTGARYDLEDVVFPNVALDLEVRSGEFAIGGFSRELYDEQANLALGSSTRITTWNVGTSHTEVHQCDGATMRRVAAWVVEHL